MKKWLKMDEKLRLWLTFCPVFARFSKMRKVAKNGQKVKATGLLFCYVSPLYQK
jgi:hypothetical protein